MMNLNFAPVDVDGVEVINTTPHSITFGVGTEVKEVPSHCVISARAGETKGAERPGLIFVETRFEATKEATVMVEAIKEAFPEAVIVGSIIAVHAFPGDVVAMTPLPGFERVAPAEKRMDPHKFTIFQR